MNIPNLIGHTILIAEDNPQSSDYFRNVIRETGATILSAFNGVETVKLCKEHHEINLVLMDAMMPKMNGFDAAREIRKFNPSIPIVIVTAYVNSATIHETVSSQCNDYLAKPVRRGDLFEIAKKWIGKPE